MKFGFWQFQITKSDCHKTAFIVPFGHYKWNVIPFELKNAPSEFQNIMNDIFTPYTSFIIVYIDDVLVFSKTTDLHFKHLQIFLHITKKNRLVVSTTKMVLFKAQIKFLDHDIFQGAIKPILRSLAFLTKFPDTIKDKKQLQRFLGCLHYISYFFPGLRQMSAPLYRRLRKNAEPWFDIRTDIVRQIKQKVESLPCLGIPQPPAFMIVETDVSNIGYGGILQQKMHDNCLLYTSPSPRDGLLSRMPSSA